MSTMILKVLPVLRALHGVYGPITVIHFDSHLDTWPAKGYGYGSDDTSLITHGTFFWTAAQEHLIKNGTSVHAGIRCKMNVRLKLSLVSSNSTVGHLENGLLVNT